MATNMDGKYMNNGNGSDKGTRSEEKSLARMPGGGDPFGGHSAGSGMGNKGSLSAACDHLRKHQMERSEASTNSKDTNRRR